MSQSLLKTCADFNTTLVNAVAVGDTTATLTSATDDDGVALPTGTYGFTIDRKSSVKEFYQCTLTGTALTNIKTLARGTAVATTGFARAHRKGAEIIISDFAVIKRIVDLLDGTTGFDSGTPLGYDGTVTPTTANQFATKSYVDATATGTTNVDRLVVAGNGGETITAGQLVYLNVADGEWYKCDADTAASVDNIILGIAQGAGSDGATITGGVMLQGLDTHQTGLTTNTAYYASNTAGGISTTPGTTEVSVGISRSTTSLLFYPRYNQELTEDQQDALAGTSGTPSVSNKFVTDADTASAATANKVARRNATGDVTVPTTPAANTDAASKSYVDSQRSTLTIPLGESFTGATTPQPAYIVDDLFQPVMQGGVFVGLTSYDSGEVSQTRYAIRIIPRTTVTSTEIQAVLFKVGAPSDNIVIKMQTDSGGSPSGTTISNGTSNNVAGSSLSTSSKTYQTFTFASAFTLTAGTTYWAVFERTGATSDTDYYGVCANKQLNEAYASFTGKYSDNAGSPAWTAGYLPYIRINPEATSSGSFSLWKSDSNGQTNNGGLSEQFNGFVTSTGSAGDSGTIVLSGTVSGFSSLLSQRDYSVSATVGTIELGRGSYVGTTQSTSSINVPTFKRGQPIVFGTVSTTNMRSASSNIFQAYYDGIITLVNTTDATLVIDFQVRTASDSAFTDNVTTYYIDGSTGTARYSIAVPVKKGMFIEFGQGTGSSTVTATFIPEY